MHWWEHVNCLSPRKLHPDIFCTFIKICIPKLQWNTIFVSRVLLRQFDELLLIDIIEGFRVSEICVN